MTNFRSLAAGWVNPLCSIYGLAATSALYELRKIWYYLRMHSASQFQHTFFGRLENPRSLGDLFAYLPEVYFYVKDSESRFVAANEPVYSMCGLTSEEQMIGRTDFDFFPRHLADRYVNEDRQVMQNRTALPNQVWLVPNHVGQLKWFISTKIPLIGTDQQAIGLAGTMRDFERAESVVQPYQELEEVLAYVLNNFAEKIEVRKLAALVHLSVSQFDRKFKSLFQMTPQQYILRVRINAACQALTSGNETVAQIALRTGFYDQSYFTKQFRKHMGMTPLAYRKAYQRRT